MKKILVVDDNIYNIKLVEAAMLSYDFKILTAYNGEEGIEKAKEEIPNLILMDIQMPKVNGNTAMKEIKKTNGLEDVPIIAYTAYAMRGDREKLIRDGFDDYLEKPVTIATLVELVNKHIG